MNEWKIFKNKVGIIPLEKGERIHLDIQFPPIIGYK